MAVGAQHHFAAAGQHFPGILVDDRLVGGHIVAAVFYRGGQTEGMVVGIDGAAHGAQAVVAVGEHIGHGEFRQPAGLGGLNHAHIGDIMGDETVERQVQQAVAAAGVVGAEDAAGHGLLPGCRHGGCGLTDGAAGPEDGKIVQLDHRIAPLSGNQSVGHRRPVQ